MSLRSSQRTSAIFRALSSVPSVTIATAKLLLLLLILPLVGNAQCPPPVGNGSHTITAEITKNSTGVALNDGDLVSTGDALRFDSIVTTNGGCEAACTSYPNLINHIAVTADISTNGFPNGNYSVGNVFGRNPDGSTGYFQVLDTQATNSTGPIIYTPSTPGTYTFHIQGIIDRCPACPNIPDVTDMIDITINIGDADNAILFADDACHKEIGRPVNVTSGNMYLKQTDYRLPGVGAGLELTRTYNSKKQVSGLFGFSWSSILDESISTYGTKLLRLNLEDGRAVYLSRADSSSPYSAAQPQNFRGQVVKNVDNSYTLTFKDGRVQQFNASGKLVSFADANGNANTLTYSGNNPVTITDASGRTVTLTYDGYGLIGSMSDRHTQLHLRHARPANGSYASQSNQ